MLLNKDKIDEAIMELNLAIKGEIGLIQEVHFVSVIEDLGRLKVEASRDVLKEIIQKSIRKFLKSVLLKPLAKLGTKVMRNFLYRIFIMRILILEEKQLLPWEQSVVNMRLQIWKKY